MVIIILIGLMVLKFKMVIKETNNYFIKVLTRNLSDTNHLSYGPTAIILALKTACELDLEIN